MQHEFNEQEYRRQLIEGGLSEAAATHLAARTAAARRDSGSAGYLAGQRLDGFKLLHVTADAQTRFARTPLDERQYVSQRGAQG